MERFPQSVRTAMDRSGSAATCLPVELDSGQSDGSPQWESAIFFQIAGPESKEDRRRLRKSEKPVAVGVETDLISHEKAGVVVLRLEVYTREDDPLVGEVLFAPGEHQPHFETLELLTRQPRLVWFFGDQSYHVLKKQQFSMSSDEHQAFQEILNDTVRHDALLRMTTGYDANAALSDIVSRYEMRQATEQSDYHVPDLSKDKPHN